MHKIKQIILAIIIMVLIPLFIQQGTNIFAQDISGSLSIYLTLQQMQSSTLSDLYLPSSGNSAAINQFGNTNTAYINQVSANTISNGNSELFISICKITRQILLKQEIIIKAISVKKGLVTRHHTTVEGNNNKTGILQLGDNNTASQDISGDSKGYLILQKGNNNTFSQIGSNETVSGYKIYQTGSGMNLKILNGSY